MSNIAGIETDKVELHRRVGGVFALRVGHNVIRLDKQAVSDICALLDPTQYPNGSIGQTFHVDREYRENADPCDAAVLIAHIGAYDRADEPSAHGVASEPYRKPSEGHTPNPSILWLSVSATNQTYVAMMSRGDAVQLITVACGLGDAS